MKEEIIKEFWEKFTYLKDSVDCVKLLWNMDADRELTSEDIEDFILKALASQKQEILEEAQKDLDNGKFYQICSNETTFMDYLKQLTIKI